MTIDNVRLPSDVERGAQGGPGFNTTVLMLSSGLEKRNQNWSQTRGSWDVGYGIQHKDDMQTVIDFFYARRGRARGFRFKDWSDYQMPKQDIGVGDGVNLDFQIFKRYTSGGVDFDRILSAVIEDDKFKVYKNDVIVSDALYSVDTLTGLITFTVAPALSDVISVECEFDVPVRFDTDKLEINMLTFEAGTFPQIPIVELKPGQA